VRPAPDLLAKTNEDEQHAQGELGVHDPRTQQPVQQSDRLTLDDRVEPVLESSNCNLPMPSGGRIKQIQGLAAQGWCRPRMDGLLSQTTVFDLGAEEIAAYRSDRSKQGANTSSV